jgi:hypothetical protein
LVIKMKIKQVFIIALLALSAADAAFAEFSCEGGVGYKWKKGEAEKEEHFGSYNSKGVTEDEAKANLKKITDNALGSAMSACREAHENLSGCMTFRYKQLGSSYDAMSFAVRKEMDGAIKGDCEKAQGQCLSAAAVDAKCVEIKVVVQEEAAEAKDGKDAKKDGKKDGKK